MPLSSSESWSARVSRFARRRRSQTPTADASTVSGEPTADIIDLDRFMRSGVKPSQRTNSDEDDRYRPRETRRDPPYRSTQPHGKARESLIVDAGAISRKVSGGKSAERVQHPSSESETAVSDPPIETRSVKRFSHDSGMSDASYNKKRHHRNPRRGSGTDRGAGGKCRDAEVLGRDRRRGSTASLRAFREACEQTLKQQQEQIARVAQLCERLTQVAPSTPVPQPQPPPPPSASAPTVPPAPKPHPRRAAISSATSDSSTTTDQRRKDKQRTQQCKTYKIIMNKLDELNRLFESRSPHCAPAHLTHPSHPAHPSHRSYVCRPHRSNSHSTRSISASASVSVSDKLLSTAEPRRRCKVVTLQARGSPTGRGEGEGRGRVVCLHMADPRRFTAHSSHAHYDRLHLECSCSKDGARLSNHENLDSIRVYSSTRRTSVAGSCAVTEHRTVEPGLQVPKPPENLCTICRVYLRCFRNCFANQVLCRPDLASAANS